MALSVSKRVEDAISACIIENESLLLLCRLGAGEIDCFPPYHGMLARSRTGTYRQPLAR
jgi:hypothetical protein